MYRIYTRGYRKHMQDNDLRVAKNPIMGKNAYYMPIIRIIPLLYAIIAIYTYIPPISKWYPPDMCPRLNKAPLKFPPIFQKL